MLKYHEICYDFMASIIVTYYGFCLILWNFVPKLNLLLELYKL